jgi:two-component system, sporulation sensor kinase E
MVKRTDDNKYARRILSVIEQTSDGVVLTDMKGNIEYANHAWLMMHDIRFSDVYGMSVSDAYEGEERDKVAACFDTLAETSEYVAEFAHGFSGEAALPTLFFARVIKDGAGNAVGVNIFERDVSKMRELEGTLRVMRESFLNIVQKSVVGMLVIDDEGAILFANAAAELLFKRKADLLVHQHIGIPVLEGEMTETGIIRPDGEPGIAAMSMTRTEWENQPAYLVMLKDITEQRHAEEETKKLLQLKSDILANISHELRTPLNNIIGYVELSMSRADKLTSEKATMFLERTMLNARDLLDIVNGLLAASSLQVEEVVVNRERFALGELIDDCISTDNVIKKCKSINISMNIEKPDIEMFSDRKKIETIVVSLLSNAIKFTEKGDVAVSARHMSGRPGWVTIEVKDTGIGIPEDARDKIFEGFKQLDGSNTRRYGGLGMGLFLVNRCVQILGGEVEVDSKLGSGSTFTVHLPKKHIKK